MVHEGRLDEGDGRQSDDSERRPGCTVRFWLLGRRVTLINWLRLGNGCLGIFEELNRMHLDVLTLYSAFLRHLFIPFIPSKG